VSRGLADFCGPLGTADSIDPLGTADLGGPLGTADLGGPLGTADLGGPLGTADSIESLCVDSSMDYNSQLQVSLPKRTVNITVITTCKKWTISVHVRSR
jgi:hypothetical protein